MLYYKYRINKIRIMKPTFSIEESLRFGWHKTREHSKVLFQILITLFALQVAQAVVSATLSHQMIGMVATFAIIIAEVILGIGLTLITLKIAKGEHVAYADVVPPLKLAWEYILASLLAGFVILLGFILLIIPGIYLSLRFSMLRFAVLEGAGITGSIKKSGKITEGVKWKLLGFFIIVALVNLLGAILFMIGLLVTVPVTMIAYAHIYQKLATHHHAA